MDKNKPVRLDKYLWAVRIYKTRTQASGACRMGRILVNGCEVKPSRMIEEKDVITVKKPPVIFTYRVISTTETRVSAKLVPGLIEDITPENEKNKSSQRQPSPFGFRQKGSGRPTKKERRIIDRWQDNISDI